MVHILLRKWRAIDRFAYDFLPSPFRRTAVTCLFRARVCDGGVPPMWPLPSSLPELLSSRVLLLFLTGLLFFPSRAPLLACLFDNRGLSKSSQSHDHQCTKTYRCNTPRVLPDVHRCNRELCRIRNIKQNNRPATGR